VASVLLVTPRKKTRKPPDETDKEGTVTAPPKPIGIALTVVHAERKDRCQPRVIAALLNEPRTALRFAVGAELSALENILQRVFSDDEAGSMAKVAQMWMFGATGAFVIGLCFRKA